MHLNWLFVLIVVVVVIYLGIGAGAVYALSQSDGAPPSKMDIVKFVLTWPLYLLAGFRGK